MVGRRIVCGLAVCLLTAVFVGQLLSGPAQPGPRAGARGPRSQRPPGGQVDREQMRRMMTERMRERIGATDDEWKVMEPRLQKVMDLSRQLNAGGRMGMFFGRGGRPGRGPGQEPAGAPEREVTPVEKASEELQALLENESAKPDQIKAKLTALRTAKEKVKQDLAKAQQDLQKILSVKQEATFVLMGLLN